MRLNVTGFIAFCLFALLQPAWLHAQDQIRDLVVKIHAIDHTPDLLLAGGRRTLPSKSKGPALSSTARGF